MLVNIFNRCISTQVWDSRPLWTSSTFSHGKCQMELYSMVYCFLLHVRLPWMKVAITGTWIVIVCMYYLDKTRSSVRPPQTCCSQQNLFWVFYLSNSIFHCSILHPNWTTLVIILVKKVKKGTAFFTNYRVGNLEMQVYCSLCRVTISHLPKGSVYYSNINYSIWKASRVQYEFITLS